MRVALGQVDPLLGEVEENLEQARVQVKEAAAAGAELVVFPELSLHGYALGLAGADTSVPANDRRLLELGDLGIDVVVGLHEDAGLRRFNSSVYLSGGEVLHVHRKLYLPTYLVWEERKHASPGQSARAFDTAHGRMAMLICNDLWQPPLPWLAVQDGARVLIVPTNSASGTGPAALDNVAYWGDLLRTIAKMQQCFVVFVNRVGDEAGVRFWGGSRVIGPTGEVVCEAPLWSSALTVADFDVDAVRRARRSMPLVSEARLGLVQRELERLIAAEGDA